LIWPSSSDDGRSGDDDGIDGGDRRVAALAQEMEIEATFLIELCESCIGLVESVPTKELQAIQ
jgi:hypothetical protein